MIQYEYYVAPFIGQVKMNDKNGARTVSDQLQQAINHYASQGWEFYQLGEIKIAVNPGCMGMLGGAKTTMTSFDQLIFRRPISSS